MKDSSGVASVISLFRDDASLAEATVWLREAHLEGERAPLRAERLLDLLNDGLLPDGLVAKHLDQDGMLIVEQAGQELPIERLSDGYRAVTALVFDLVYRIATAHGPAAIELDRSNGPITIDCPGVVLIDEAETHLHPSWQRKLGFWLVEHFPNIQFIVTTHSPFICQAAAHGSLIRLSLPGDPRPPARLEGDDYWTVVNGSPNDAMLTELFGLDRLISDESEQLRETVAELDVKQMDATLTPAEAEQLERARARLPNQASAELDRFRRLLEGMATKDG
ncbi:AAA family ATPase [Nannocystaceae bacterium ST9]